MLPRLSRLIAVTSLLILTGCATVPPVTAPRAPAAAGSGFYHRVAKGQTLWRIAKIYSLDLDELINLNHIRDTGSIGVGQLLFIPGVAQNPKVASGGFKDEDFIWPVKGKVIAKFGEISDNSVNEGLNIEPWARSQVLASRNGRVVFLDNDFLNLGKTVIIEHPDGFWTVYAGLAEVLVKPGDLLQKSNPVGRIAEPGRNKIRYLHFEIRKGGVSQNPYFYLP
jgi:murein DD-endopeptidase MepM/ murein hydrolase activator NlpD